MTESEIKFCANEKMAIDILDFIKRGYEKNYQDGGVKKYTEALQMGIDALTELNRQQAEIERLNLENLQMVASIKRLANEAIKEFAERLKEMFVNNSFCGAYVLKRIDNLVKEMECGNDAKRSSNT